MTTAAAIAFTCAALAYVTMLAATGWCVFAPQQEWGDRVNGVVMSLALIALGAMVFL